MLQTAVAIKRKPPITARERQILKLVVDGYSNKEISDMLNLSPRTIEAHRARIMFKLKLTNLADLVKFAIRQGITTVNEHRGKPVQI